MSPCMTQMVEDINAVEVVPYRREPNSWERVRWAVALELDRQAGLIMDQRDKELTLLCVAAIAHDPLIFGQA